MRAISYRRRRSLAIAIIGLIISLLIAWKNHQLEQEPLAETASDNPEISSQTANTPQPLAIESLAKIEVKGRAQKTGYVRSQFGDGWTQWKSCNTRQQILARDLTNIKFGEDGCTVLSGTLNDPYTGEIVQFTRGVDTSDDIQIDHIVALSDAWQKGAQQLTLDRRTQLANDDLELVAVSGASNQEKSDSDAATWLPKNKAFRCQYVARQIAVKIKYSLWVTQAEHDAMSRVLISCPEQRLPTP